MGGLEIDPESRVLDNAGKPIPGLFASGEIAGGVHGANRLGGSSLLGCVVFGRVAGDTASSYIFKGISTGKIAAGRAGQVAQQLATTVKVHPESKRVDLSFSWGEEGGSSGGLQTQSTGAAQSSPPVQTNNAAGPKQEEAPKAETKKEYTLDDVAKHTTEEDCWVVVNGEVLAVSSFLDDHPGG